MEFRLDLFREKPKPVGGREQWRHELVQRLGQEMDEHGEVTSEKLRAELAQFAVGSLDVSGDWYRAVEKALRTHFTEDEQRQE